MSSAMNELHDTAIEGRTENRVYRTADGTQGLITDVTQHFFSNTRKIKIVGEYRKYNIRPQLDIALTDTEREPQPAETDTNITQPNMELLEVTTDAK